MSALVNKNGVKIRKARAERIDNIIAPMYARGATQREIAEAAGISHRQVFKDLELVREVYQDDFESHHLTIRGELVAKHNMLFREALLDHARGAGVRALEVASKQLEAVSRLYGVTGGVNLNLHQHNVAVDAGAIAELFKPMDPGQYADMVSTRTLPPAESAPLPEVEPEDEPGTSEWIAVEAPAEEPTPEPKKRRPFPFRV